MSRRGYVLGDSSKTHRVWSPMTSQGMGKAGSSCLILEQLENWFTKSNSRGDSPVRLTWCLRVRNERPVVKAFWARKVAWKAEGTISPLETWSGLVYRTGSAFLLRPNPPCDGSKADHLRADILRCSAYAPSVCECSTSEFQGRYYCAHE